ncbi:hypothetical protein [Bradyrhizobium roseum]|uniref:hypothetical protein n=1 Tax=Bradyrhizobium roseum TaxID=3056648 RepID=UPI00261C7CF2|nr:hypothetical protein [Bradyrhizobium roseus]WKA30052.1 hypothetical protein QUH67_07730 [Bradyrhizobium roseus]
MDSDAWRPFDPVDVKRQVAPGRRGNNRRGFIEPPSDDDDYASGDSEYTWLDGSVVTFITLAIARHSCTQVNS